MVSRKALFRPDTEMAGHDRETHVPNARFLAGRPVRLTLQGPNFVGAVYLLQPFTHARRLCTTFKRTSEVFPRAAVESRILGHSNGTTSDCDPEGEAMSSSGQFREVDVPISVLATGYARWYALHTRARHERVAAQRLWDRGVTTFLPVITEVRRWSDRRKSIEVPLFPCYVFVRMVWTPEERLRVIEVNGILGLVGERGHGTPIPDEQIDAVRALLAQKIPWSFHPFLKAGQRVRIRGGALDGVEGIFQARDRDQTLVISVDAVQRSLAVHISGYDIEVL
jgi:transcription antitermination factor NusG